MAGIQKGGFMFRSILSVSLICVVSGIAAPPAVEEQAVSLSRILKAADDAYYNRNESILSDAAYDGLREQYDGLVQAYPELKELERVGCSVSGSKKKDHTKPVLSLSKAYSDEEVEAFIHACGTNRYFCVEPKIDGLTVVLNYRDGLLTQVLTRGNGKAGSDVTEAVMASGCAPLQLQNAPAVLDVRGEVFIPVDAFEALNKRRVLIGKEPLKSPRNTAAGTLRLDDCSEIAKRKLKLRIFEIIDASVMPSTHLEGLLNAGESGLPVIECRRTDGADVLAAIATMNEHRSGLPYLTDGIVVKVDNTGVYTEMGSTAHHPRGAIARKYKETPVETTLVKIEWSKAATGRMTPIAVFEPVELCGATVSRASLYNEEHLRALNLAVGDRIQVIRAGGAVPEVLGAAD